MWNVVICDDQAEILRDVAQKLNDLNLGEMGGGQLYVFNMLAICSENWKRDDLRRASSLSM